MMSSIRRKIIRAGNQPGAVIPLTEDEMECLRAFSGPRGCAENLKGCGLCETLRDHLDNLTDEVYARELKENPLMDSIVKGMNYRRKQ